MRGKTAILTTLMLFAMPAASAAAGPIGSGHIEAGSPHTSLTSVSAATGEEGVDSFRVDVSDHTGENLTTQTTDNGGLGYDLDFYWYDANNSYVSACATPAVDEDCEVPTNATTLEVAAYVGVDLDVTVVHS